MGKRIYFLISRSIEGNRVRVSVGRKGGRVEILIWFYFIYLFLGLRSV